jgi:hypothetical protein
LPSKHEALDSIISTAKQERRKKQRERRKEGKKEGRKERRKSVFIFINQNIFIFKLS